MVIEEDGPPASAASAIPVPALPAPKQTKRTRAFVWCLATIATAFVVYYFVRKDTALVRNHSNSNRLPFCYSSRSASLEATIYLGPGRLMR